MSVFLVGGGFRDGSEEAVYGGFVSEAVARAASAHRSATEAAERAARIVVLTVREDAHPGHGNTLASVVQNVAGDRPVEVTTTVVAEGEPMPASALDGADGILVGGGLTPAYLSAFAPLAARIRREVETGVPYLGFSAGAMIAPDRALLGGWLIGGIEVVAQDAAEDLDELTIEEGLGLIDVTVDVHAVQWGNLSRAIAAVDSGAVDEVIAIDEATVLAVGSGPLRASGAGTVWAVTKDDRGVLVRSMR
ncbi:Type 1 glutamine amidotransferase-like domain-containing protein [Humibacter sp.]|jgi:cyanophycinase|uniref:Type 1 glutamine amidotransferase-like domain-containing protein n=1 Tax=Humibacter sp. TaxID=1940291 RepID=UPI003F7CDA32